MQVVELVSRENGVAHEEIVLFRHANKDVEIVLDCHASLEEWTSVQPTGTRYDYWDEGKTKILVVIVRNRVFGVYRVTGIDAEGPRYSLASKQLIKSFLARNKKDVPARRFALERVDSSATGATVTGWEGKEINPVARSGGTLFWEIEVDVPKKS